MAWRAARATVAEAKGGVTAVGEDAGDGITRWWRRGRDVDGGSDPRVRVVEVRASIRLEDRRLRATSQGPLERGQ